MIGCDDVLPLYSSYFFTVCFLHQFLDNISLSNCVFYLQVPSRTAAAVSEDP